MLNSWLVGFSMSYALKNSVRATESCVLAPRNWNWSYRSPRLTLSFEVGVQVSLSESVVNRGTTWLKLADGPPATSRYWQGPPPHVVPVTTGIVPPTAWLTV